MRFLDLPAEVAVLLLRLGMVAVLYLFLVSVFLLARRELRQQAQRAAAPGRLVVVDAGTTHLPTGERLPLQPVTTLGRAHGCTLPLDDSFVSATHAVLAWHDGRWWLRDAGSTNGTLLNERPVGEAEAPIAYGDVIRLGTVRLELAP
jgi:hypothetical protein